MMAMNRFAYASASSIDEAQEALNDACRPLAGGMDLLGMMKEGLIAPQRLVNLKRIADLDGVEAREDGLHIGALTTLSRLQSNPAIGEQDEVACLREALARTASPQIRHMATIGGNLLQRPRCWYFRNQLTHCLRKGGRVCFAFRGENKYHAILGGGPCYIVHPSDPVVALLALDAAVVVTGPDGSRTVPLTEFYLLPRQDRHNEVSLAAKELITEVFIPAPVAGSRGTYLKAAERGSWDFALVSVAVQLALSEGIVHEARVALGGVAPAPWRATESEEALRGNALTDEVIERAAQAATTGARPLTQNAFKVDMAQGLVRQALQELRS
jgi:xanthine dehydrogenase YagS FAD-binding subunit